MKKFSIFFLLLNVPAFVIAQEVISNICLNYAYDEEREYKGYDFKSDTLNCYLLFGSEYRNDSVTVYCNDTIFYYKSLQTDYSYGYSDIIKLPIQGKIYLKINNMPTTELPSIHTKNYICVTYFREDKRLNIDYSKFCPKIY